MRDIHADTAQRLYGEVTPEIRAKAKIINYVAMWGMPASKLLEELTRAK